MGLPGGMALERISSTSSTVVAALSFEVCVIERYCTREPDANLSYTHASLGM